LELVHINIYGPFKLPFLGGAWYLISFVDDFFVGFGSIVLLGKTKHLINSKSSNMKWNMRPRKKL
jgi:hypothetical protein